MINAPVFALCIECRFECVWTVYLKSYLEHIGEKHYRRTKPQHKFKILICERYFSAPMPSAVWTKQCTSLEC